MTEPLFSRVLLTNDDGIDAPGLTVLEDVARQLAREVWVVAPMLDQSGTSHSVSLHDPLRISRLGERRFAVGGTPGDCVTIGVRHLLAATPPDIILSGINRGANLGRETVFSGTVGAAMTGMLLGIPSIALSQAFTHPAPVKWETARALAPDVIRRLAGLTWSGDACLNVNFPDFPAEESRPLVLTRQGRGLLDGIDVLVREDPRGLAYHWLKLERSRKPDHAGTETEAVAAGHVSVTPLRFERTHEDVWDSLRRQMTPPRGT
ncbi:5'/3'-nucleotidase SurE [Gluconacetobacter sacchari]|uniref:5'-nucleotidase SurE n=2 Tax=Gluconacetobacter sacchari TaxID=92759 RepID=A0A7W4IEC5_9PROT|nr:5'/3'-nucleotidase SurE [Gluconacetobacter sacchari]MBB2161304.1 5'/3'-nucleotidase SurE [Gluconacetobacter sacchari]GBQ23595.1 exopolyphosphatase [Gluconacetobacter sacchari DSM 12717]